MSNVKELLKIFLHDSISKFFVDQTFDGFAVMVDALVQAINQRILLNKIQS
jgi:hypothetical protein